MEGLLKKFTNCISPPGWGVTKVVGIVRGPSETAESPVEALAIGLETVCIDLTATATASASLAALIESFPGLAKIKPRKSLTLGLGFSL